MRFWIKIIGTALFLGGGGFLVIAGLESSWQYFIGKCPSTDVLSWDANLRLIDVLDQYQDFREGRWLSALWPYFDSPTWPTFRGIVAQIVFWLAPDEPNTILDVSISFAFYILLFPSILFIGWELSRDWFRGSAVFFFASMMTLHTQELPVYSVSSMLETQGMFFMLWTMYFLFKIYNWQFLREFSRTGGEQRALPMRRRFVWGLFFMSLGVFHTKYPYGLMLILAWFAYDVFRNPAQYTGLAGFALRRHFYGVRRVLLIAAACIILLYALRGNIPALDTKYFKYFVWLLTLLILIDFHFYLWKFRIELLRFMDSATRQIYLAMVLPSLIWLYMHPDRISSTLGTQQKNIGETSSYFSSLRLDVFDTALPLLLALGFLIVAWFSLMLAFRKRYPGEGRAAARALRQLTGRPLTAAFFIIGAQFFILELLTGNKQLRHIYHLIPAGMVAVGAWTVRFGGLYPSALSRPERLWRLTLWYGGLLVCLSGAWPLFQPGGLLHAWPAALAEGRLVPEDGEAWVDRRGYAAARPLCFTGVDREFYEPVRWFARRIDPTKRYILINSFHDRAYPQKRARMEAGESNQTRGAENQPPEADFAGEDAQQRQAKPLEELTPEEVQARLAELPGRRVQIWDRFIQGVTRATDFDLLLRMRTLQQGAVRNDSSEREAWREFDSALLLTTLCNDPYWDERLRRRAGETESILVEVRELRHPSGNFCLSEYRIIE